MQAPFNEELSNDIQRMQHVINMTNFSTKEHLKTTASLLAQNKDLINAIQTINHSTFSSFSEQLLQDVHTDFVTITDNKGFVIWRENISKKGDSILNQETVVNALKGKPSSALVFGTEVPFTLRSSYPVMNQKKNIIGTISIGINLANPHYVDYLKKLSGMEVSIFKGHTCKMTTLLQNDERILGYKLQSEKIVTTVLQKGETLFTQDNILGVTYKASYWPIKAADGKIIGMWFIGFPLDQLLILKNQAIFKSLGISIALLIILLPLFILLGVQLGRPIRKISHYISSISNQEKATLDIYTNDDIGRLANKLRHMVATLQARSDELRLLAYKDPLTNLWNRKYFIETFCQEIALSLRHNLDLCICVADIDHFKNVNDTYGHLTGDIVLKQIARLFQDNLRSSDIVARYGGEEFIFLLPHTSLKEGLNVFEKLRILCENLTITADDQTIGITVSFGLTMLTHDTELSPDALKKLMIKHADEALYQSKADGRNRVTANPIQM